MDIDNLSLRPLHYTVVVFGWRQDLAGMAKHRSMKIFKK